MPTEEKQKSFQLYGITFPDVPENSRLKIPLLRELFFFKMANTERFRASTIYTQEGRAYHGRKAAEILWPNIIWHPDLVTMFTEFCSGTQEIPVTGPASAGKTFAAALYAILFWMCSPQDTGVLLGSTTMKGVRQRIWSETRKLFMAIPQKLSKGNGWNLVENPTPAIQSSRGDAKFGIFCTATDGGEDKRIGFHPKRILCIADELTGIPWNLIQDLTNLFTGKVESQFIGLGNASSIFDSHGKMCEPADGWNSVNVNSESWKTRRGGICLHFDGFKSPNIIAGEVIYDFLLTQADINATASREGENSPAMWRMRRGFWCPEGAVKSILSESLLQKMQAQNKAEWEAGTVEIAMLDPAFEGGDRCVFRFARCGQSSILGLHHIEFGEILIVKLDVESKRPIHYQIADFVKEQCQKRGIPPVNFAMDTTGEGGGLASIIKETWGGGFLEVEFGGKADDDVAAAPNDSRNATDVYQNKVTQLWHGFRDAVQWGQVRGLDPESCIEFCTRTYQVGANNKIVVEKKSDLKLRLGKSPDNSDAAVIGLFLARKRGYIPSPRSKAVEDANRNWIDLANEQEQDSEEEFLSDPFAAVLYE